MHRRFSAAAVFAVISFGLALPAEDKLSARHFVIEVTNQARGSERSFRGAVGFDGQLELVEAETPFRKEVKAVGLTAIFAVADGKGDIQVVLYGTNNNKLVKYGGVSGRAVRIIDDPRDPLVPLSFSNF